jgi:hypothetical protein
MVGGMRPPVPVVLHLARIAWLASEYGLIASLFISAAITLAASLGNLFVKLVKGRCRPERAPAAAQLTLS